MKIIKLAILIFLTRSLFAQGQYDVNWCFGIKAGIKFSDTSQLLNFNTLCNNYEAAASISDSLGNLLFYIAPDTPFYIYGELDAQNAIYDGNNQVIQNGDSMYVGDGLTSAMFLPVPERQNAYYVFYMSRLPLYGSAGQTDHLRPEQTDRLGRFKLTT